MHSEILGTLEKDVEERELKTHMASENLRGTCAVGVLDEKDTRKHPYNSYDPP